MTEAIVIRKYHTYSNTGWELDNFVSDLLMTWGYENSSWAASCLLGQEHFLVRVFIKLDRCRKCADIRMKIFLVSLNWIHTFSIQYINKALYDTFKHLTFSITLKRNLSRTVHLIFPGAKRNLWTSPYNLGLVSPNFLLFRQLNSKTSNFQTSSLLVLGLNFTKLPCLQSTRSFGFFPRRTEYI